MIFKCVGDNRQITKWFSVASAFVVFDKHLLKQTDLICDASFLALLLTIVNVCVWAGWNHRLSMLWLWKLWVVRDPEDKSLRLEWSFWTIRTVTSWGMSRDQLGRETSLPSLSPREKQEDSDRSVTISMFWRRIQWRSAGSVIVSSENLYVELVFCFACWVFLLKLCWDFITFMFICWVET